MTTLFQFDNFTLNIDISQESQYSSIMLINKASEIAESIHIINFSDFDIKNYFLINDTKSQEFIENVSSIVPKLIFVEHPVKSFKWLHEYLDTLSKDDLLLLNGIEKLLGYTQSSHIAKSRFGELIVSMHLMENENWKELTDVIDKIYGEYQNKLYGIFTNIFTDTTCRSILLELLKDTENMSIISVCGATQDIEYELSQRDLIVKIKNLPLQAALNEIEKSKTFLTDSAYNYFCAIANYNSGNISESISLMESQYKKLNNEAKLTLADIYIANKSEPSRKRANEILTELYEHDKNLKGLYSSFLRLYDSDENQFIEKNEYWLNIALKIDPDHPAVLEANANKLGRNKDYKAAAVEYRKLSSIVMPEYYELLARVNEVLNGDFQDNQEIIDYIYSHAKCFPQIINEAVYRLATYFIVCKDSFFLAYKCLKEANLKLGQPRLKEILSLKMDILKDEKKASKALGKLKIYRKPQDAQKLNSTRAHLLIESVSLLSGHSHGYLLWRNFLECQSDNSWNTSLYDCLKDAIKKLLHKNILDLIKASPTQAHIEEDMLQDFSEHEDIQCLKEKTIPIRLATINILRKIKSGEEKFIDTFKDYDELYYTMCATAELIDDNSLRIWTRYYLSIIASKNGNGQTANENALAILDFYSRADSETNNLCLFLGLTAWANSQFRSGRHVEAIACIIAAIEYSIESDEIVPLIEEGLNLIGRYISEDVSELAKNDSKFWNQIKNDIGTYNKFFNDVLTFDPDVQMKQLNQQIVDSKIKDEDWAVQVANLIAYSMKNNKHTNAFNIVQKYRNQVVPLLEKRKDVRYYMLYNWAFLYLEHSNEINNIFTAMQIIKQAENDLETVRGSFSHKEERAGLNNISLEIYRMHLGICSMLIKLLSKENSMYTFIKDEILSILPKLSPRTILEQKAFNKSKYFNPKALELKKELDFVTSEYNNIFEKDSSNFKLLSEKAEKIQNLSSNLKRIHPNYMNLEERKNIALSEIISCLSADELIFQYIVTPVGVFTLILSKDNMYFDLCTSDIEEPIQKYAQIYSELMQGDNSSNIDAEILEQLTTTLSRSICQTLIDFVSSRKVKNLYCIPDFMLYMFPLITAKMNDVELINHIDSLTNLIDYDCLMHERSSVPITKVVHRIFGDSSDSELKKIDIWLHTLCKENNVILENNSDEYNIPKTENQFAQSGCICIYGHGVSDPNADILFGAKGIEGKTSIIDLDEIVDLMSCYSNIFLISCRGGSPNYEKIDETNGTWSAIFEKYSGNIILCKWDVITQATIELLNDILLECVSNGYNVSEALVIAQKRLKAKYSSPQLWAGIEFWIN